VCRWSLLAYRSESSQAVDREPWILGSYPRSREEANRESELEVAVGVRQSLREHGRFGSVVKGYSNTGGLIKGVETVQGCRPGISLVVLYNDQQG
jgi:hypothetical protein